MRQIFNRRKVLTYCASRRRAVGVRLAELCRAGPIQGRSEGLERGTAEPDLRHRLGDGFL